MILDILISLYVYFDYVKFNQDFVYIKLIL